MTVAKIVEFNFVIFDYLQPLFGRSDNARTHWEKKNQMNI